MSAQPNLDKLELIADALGDLRGQLVFVGGFANRWYPLVMQTASNVVLKCSLTECGC